MTGHGSCRLEMALHGPAEGREIFGLDALDSQKIGSASPLSEAPFPFKNDEVVEDIPKL